MLRRKLLLILLYVTGLLMALAVTALWSLQDLLADLSLVNAESSAIRAQSSLLSERLSGIEVQLRELHAGRRRHLDDLIDAVESAGIIGQSGAFAYVADEAGVGPVLEGLRDRWGRLVPDVRALATARDPVLAAQYNREAIATAAALRGDLLEITRHGQQHIRGAQEGLTVRFRWLVSGMAIGFLLVINCSILLLLRTAAMVLRPVDTLVKASRELAAERFDHQVAAGQNDEFDELAGAYNRLAGQLGQNEQRKVETLHQVARTLNHELDSAMAIIDLQVTRLERETIGVDAHFEGHLRQIHDSLGRMGRVVRTLTQVRRVVLTDYGGGEKMLDLDRSAEQVPSAGPDAV